MKRCILFIFFIAAVFGTHSLSAQKVRSSFEIRLWDNALFSIEFGHIHRKKPEASFKKDRILPGSYHLRVVKHEPDVYSCSQIVVFDGDIEIPKASEVKVMITKSHQLRFVEVNPYKKLMSAKYHKQMLRAMKREPLESERYGMAAREVQKYFITPFQLYHFLRLLYSEKAKLDFARFAYRHTIDKKHFYKAYKAFSDKKSIEIMNQYVREYHKKTTK